MFTEYAGWQISDDKQREIEARLARAQLLASLDNAKSWQPGWLRLRLHYLGVRAERWGAGLQLQAGKYGDILTEEPRIGAQL